MIGYTLLWVSGIGGTVAIVVVWFGIFLVSLMIVLFFSCWFASRCCLVTKVHERLAPEMRDLVKAKKAKAEVLAKAMREDLVNAAREELVKALRDELMKRVRDELAKSVKPEGEKLEETLIRDTIEDFIKAVRKAVN